MAGPHEALRSARHSRRWGDVRQDVVIAKSPQPSRVSNVFLPPKPSGRIAPAGRLLWVFGAAHVVERALAAAFEPHSLAVA